MTGLNDKPTLPFNRVRLKPLTLQHEDGLREAVCDGRLWKLAVTSAPAPDQVAAYIQMASATRTAFAVIDECSGKVVGSTSLYHTDEVVSCVKIGFAWYAQSVQRTHVSANRKLMLLTYMFETLGCVCVGWRTDILNTASQHAIEWPGAQKDGILHCHQIRKDGSVRDTVVYNMLCEGWLAAQAALREWLEQGTEAR